MRSIRIIILGIAVAVVSITVEAQQKTLLQTEVMAKKLDLDAKQKAELDKHFKGMKSEREAAQTKMKAQREGLKRDQFVKRQEQEAKLKSILTEEQFAKVQSQRKNPKQKQARKGQERGVQGKRGVQQGRQKRQDASLQRGQRGQKNQKGQQGQVRQQRSRNEMARDPEMRKKFQEFLELEKEKKEKEAGGN
jgi:hypothetical protein